jgi:hypothetical protein
MRARNNIRFKLAACLFGMFSTAYAQDYLEPEDSIFTEFSPRVDYYWLNSYHSDVLTVFREAFGYGVIARVVVIPSFQNESVLSLLKDGNKYSIFHLQSDFHIWRIQSLKFYETGQIRSWDNEGNDRTQADIDELKKDMPASLDEIQMKRCELSIPTDLGMAVEKLWASMLYQTRYVKKNTIGTDGITYHFSANDRHQEMAGQVWSPDEDSKTGKLVEIVEVLRTACVDQDASQFSRISGMVSALTAEVSDEE